MKSFVNYLSGFFGNQDNPKLIKGKEIKDAYALYTKRIGKTKLSLEELQPLILNLAYLEIMRARKNGNSPNERRVYQDYTTSAISLFPEYESVNDSRLFIGFQATLQWDGLWNFLKEYFESKVGIRIDEERRSMVEFNSSYHERYENDTKISVSEVPRKVSIYFSEDKSTAQFSISETLSPKESFLKSKTQKRHTYLGTDADFLFVITYDDFENVEHLSLQRMDKDLRIEYFE